MPEMIFAIPRQVLSENPQMRRAALDEYFPSGLIPFERGSGHEWDVIVFTPRDADYYVDPHLENTLSHWQHTTSVEEIGSYRSIYKNAMISFYDSWSLYYWSLLFQFFHHVGIQHDEVTLYHIDDHKDLSSPHLAHEEKGYSCLFTKNEIHFQKPGTIAKAIQAKSIGIDSFITPLLHELTSVHINHIRYAYSGSPKTSYLHYSRIEDSYISAHKLRGHLKISQTPSPHTYTLSNNPLLPPNKYPILLHIDCDALSNRYNLDTNWSPQRVTIDLSLRAMKEKIDELINTFSKVASRVYLNIAFSPGFFPSEYWSEICFYILDKAQEVGIVRDDDFSHFLELNADQEERFIYATA